MYSGVPRMALAAGTLPWVMPARGASANFHRGPDKPGPSPRGPDALSDGIAHLAESCPAASSWSSPDRPGRRVRHLQNIFRSGDIRALMSVRGFVSVPGAVATGSSSPLENTESISVRLQTVNRLAQDIASAVLIAYCTLGQNYCLYLRG